MAVGGGGGVGVECRRSVAGAAGEGRLGGDETWSDRAGESIHVEDCGSGVVGVIGEGGVEGAEGRGGGRR